MNILFVTNTVKKYALVYKNVIDTMIEQGHTVLWAGNFNGFDGDINTIPCKVENIPIQSNPLKRSNISAYKILKRIISNCSINVIYCSTPIGSTIGRLAAKNNRDIKVIYAAHGFLFFKHSKKWFLNPLFKLHERILAKYTDCLITITNEDYDYANSHLKLRNKGNIYKINGAGVDISQSTSTDLAELKSSLGVLDKKIIISAGFLNKNKNNLIVIKAIKKMNDKKYVYLICGEGNERYKLEKYCNKNRIADQVLFLGYRNDISDLFAMSDIFAMPSFREGVPRSLLEAMIAGKPCIGSNTRGINDLIEEGKNGFLFNPNSTKSVVEAIKQCDSLEMNQCHAVNERIAQMYSKEVVSSQIKDILALELKNG